MDTRKWHETSFTAPRPVYTSAVGPGSSCPVERLKDARGLRRAIKERETRPLRGISRWGVSFFPFLFPLFFCDNSARFFIRASLLSPRHVFHFLNERVAERV